MGADPAANATGIYFLSKGNVVAGICIFLAAFTGFLFYLRWYRTRRGTWPQMSEAPPEIKRAYYRCFAAMGVALVAIVVIGFLSPLSSRSR